MQTELDIVRDVSMRFDRAGIAYMLTGSMAMNYYAQPRMTRDVDVVVALAPADVRKIVDLFTPDYYVSEEAVRASIAGESIFNLVHDESVIKVDCIVRKNMPYRVAEFDRREKIRIDNFTTWIASKEDLIISKLFWAKGQWIGTPNARRSKLGRDRLRRGLRREMDARARFNQPLGAMPPVTDTSPEVAAMVRDRIMSLSGAGRFIIGARMFESARAIVLASLPGNISEPERKRILYERFYGEPLPDGASVLLSR